MNAHAQVDGCLELVQRLIEYRYHKALHHQLMKAADYFSATDKGGPTRDQVDELVSAGRLEPLGFYGWGSWIGRRLELP